jgi:cellobiose-specific phosphotransferase system component IIA
MAIAAACPITNALEMQSQSSNVSAVFVLIHVQAALATSMVSSKPPSV